MNISVLDPHSVIGIDFDETLINGPNSDRLQRYVVQHSEKTFYIVTHRSHNLRASLEYELLRSNAYGLTPGHFAGILSVPDDIFEAYYAVMSQMFLLPCDPAYVAFTTWKAKTCAHHGITVLVDDNATLCRDGCVEHGIEFVDANTL